MHIKSSGFRLLEQGQSLVTMQESVEKIKEGVEYK
jgi:hypothetical protein